MKRLRLNPDLRLILIVFVGSRLMLLAAFPAESFLAYGDYEHYFNLARLSGSGLLPFLDYWYEFPPLFPLLSIILYQLTAVTSGALHSYAYALALAMLAFDAGNLILLHRLAGRLWNERVATQTAWVYLALPVGMVYTWRTFDSMTAFWLLLALDWLLAGRDKRSAVALGLGVMTKYLPVLLLPTVWAARPARNALRYTLIVAAVCALVFGPLLAISPEFGWASLKAQAAKSSWQTVWALIDGNTGTGNVGPDVEHLDPALATKSQGNPERVPGWLTLIPFVAAGLYLFWLVRASQGRSTEDESPADARLLVSFVTLTFALFLLWSKGWSPQWQLMLLPLVLLAFPGRNGVTFCVLFGLLNFLEWPVLLSRGLSEWLWLTVAARTLMLLGLGSALAKPWLARPEKS